MKIIHLISDISKVNFGIWNAALNTATILQEKYGVLSEVWYPNSATNGQLKNYMVHPLAMTPEDWANPDELIKKRQLSHKDTIIHSHGCWMSPTRLGYKFGRLGYRWIYSPHGMLEPWSRQQKKWKKEFYFRFFEKKYALKSDVIRAVGSPEKVNLQKLFSGKSITLIPNGIDITKEATQIFLHNPQLNKEFRIKKSTDPVKILFLSRLHHKKGVIPLVQAWIKSTLYGDEGYQLIIAGPDDGEKDKLTSILDAIPEGSNVAYMGAVYGNEKEELLQQSTYFILPSFSEGFPTSIVEAMSFGCIPIISDGCNFPESFEKGLAIKTAPLETEIVVAFEHIKKIPAQRITELSTLCKDFIAENYALEKIARMQYELYMDLLRGIRV